MAERPNFLASAAASGDGWVCLVEPAPVPCTLILAAGTDRWERHHVYRLTGTGPYVAWLGLSDAVRGTLFGAHMATTSVEVSDA